MYLCDDDVINMIIINMIVMTTGLTLTSVKNLNNSLRTMCDSGGLLSPVGMHTTTCMDTTLYYIMLYYQELIVDTTLHNVMLQNTGPYQAVYSILHILTYILTLHILTHTYLHTYIYQLHATLTNTSHTRINLHCLSLLQELIRQ